MKLQVAFDLQSSDEILNFIEKNGDLIDIIEIGTPLIIKEGLKSVLKIKKKFPKQTVLADLKIMDAGLLEAQIGFDAGADIVTVLGLASTKTLNGVKQADSILILIIGTIIAAPLVSFVTDFYFILPYRFIPFIVAMAIGIGVLLAKENSTQ